MAELLLWIVVGVGCLLMLTSYFFRTPGTSRVSFKPKEWKPFWKMRNYFGKPGFGLAIAGLILIWVAAVPILIMRFL